MKPILLTFSLFSLAFAVVSGAQTPKKKPVAPKYAAVQKVFNEHCIGCHGGERAKAGIDLRSYKSVMDGGEEGVIVKPGAPGHSLLVQALRGAHEARRMPPLGTPMDEATIKVVEGWILAGAKG